MILVQAIFNKRFGEQVILSKLIYLIFLFDDVFVFLARLHFFCNAHDVILMFIQMNHSFYFVYEIQIVV